VTTAVVTGAGAGIGRACAIRLSSDGYRLVVVDRDADAAERTATRLRETGGKAVVVVGDTSKRPTHRAAAEASDGDLTLWVNNAGITRGERLHEASDELVIEVMGINALGYYWGCSAAVADFLGRSVGGAIVNISSIHAHRGFSDHAAYDMSKGAVEGLTRSVAANYGPYGIRANDVAPGAVLTEAVRLSLDAETDGWRRLDPMLTATPLRRMATPEEIADAVAYLGSDAATYVSGQSLGVDGGWQAQAFVSPLETQHASRYGIDAQTGLPLRPDNP
jgi:NAD(P)-dependent dehydrogenase (short-subunit alcohol dehydrogenase family)